MEPINVAIATDAKYCQHAAVTLTSLLYNNRELSFRLFVAITEPLGPAGDLLAETISQFANATIEYLDFSRDLLPNLHLSHHISSASYVRLLLTTRLPQDFGRLLYLDSDVLVCSDISSLWGVDLKDKCLAAVPDLPYNHANIGFVDGDSYFNAGVLIIDVLKWRRENLAAQLVEYALLKGSQLTYYDQDVLNALFKNRVLFLDLKWNFQAIMAERPGCLGLSPSEFQNLRANPAIIHYSSPYKPWNYMDEVHYGYLYYRYLSLTAFRSSSPSGKGLRNRFVKLWRLKRLKRMVKWMFPSALSILRPRRLSELRLTVCKKV